MANWSYTVPPSYYLVGDNTQAALTATNQGWTDNTKYPPEVILPIANLAVLNQAALAVPSFSMTPPATPLTGTVTTTGELALTGTVSTFPAVTLTGTITTFPAAILAGTITTSGTALTGVGTSFTTQLSVGSIVFYGGYPLGTVQTITNNTTATLVAAATANVAAVTGQTSGSVNLIGSGTSFTTQLQVDSTVSVGGTVVGTIASITSNTAATFYQIPTLTEVAATATTAGSINLVGSGTSFLTQLQIGSTIYVSTTLIGTIASISSATLATFSAIPTVLESAATATCNGDVAGSTAVTGSGTSFTTQTFVGAELYYGNVKLGVVSTITNNTALVLTANALATVTAGTISSSQSFGTGSIMKFIVTPSSPVNVVGYPTIAVAVGSNNTVLTYNPNDSTSTALLFEYTVLNTDTATSGNVVPAGAMVLPVGAGVAKQLPGGNEFAVPVASLTFPIPSTIGTIVT